MNDVASHIISKRMEHLEIGNKIFKSSYNWEVTDKDLEKAERELGETEERKKECLRKLKEKLSKDSDFKYRQDDAYLLRYLRVRKYDVKKAYQNIRRFFELRKKHKELFTQLPDWKAVQELNCYTILPYSDEDGRIILLLNLNRWNPDARALSEIISTALNLYDIVSMNPRCQICGTIDIFDFDGLGLRHISEVLNGSVMWKILSIVQNGYPFRVQKVIVLHTSRFVRLLYSMLRPLLQKKVADRFVFLGSDLNELHQHVNPVLLPKRLGGTLDEKECEASQYVLDNLAYIKYERSFISA